jgi:serine/threonine protein kinase
LSASPQILDGKYELLRKLGEGGMGAVYEGRHRGTGRRVAVKVIGGEAVKKSAEIVGRFQREAMASGSLESQHIAQVLDTGVDAASGSPYLVMELLTGDDLEKTIERLGVLAPDLALRVVAQACLGLSKAHEAQVIHRDIKPANLFLARREGGELVAKILDFGIAKAMGSQLSESGSHAMTRTGMMLGSPVYMSPEQAMGRKSIDHRTDIWSLGVVLYEALCGRTPHGHSETVGELVIRICGEAPQLLQERAPWVPPEVAAIAHKALALDPAARFQTAAEMYAAIRARLPAGHALDDSMLVPLSSQSRAVSAPRFALTSDIRHQSPSFPQMSSNPDLALLEQARVTASSLLKKSTTAGFGQSGVSTMAAQPARSRAVVPIALVGVAALIAGGAFFAMRGSHAPSPAPMSMSAPAAVAPPPIASAPPPPAPVPSATAVATAELELPATPPSQRAAPRSASAAKSVPHAPAAPVIPAQPAAPPAASSHAAAATPPAAAYNPLDHL